tara:strand:+ start:300 stop:608 length:309 start_codon:yes stop_codon:yes gene_type:complete
MESKIITNTFEDIVSKRDFFLTPKRSDKFKAFMYVDGWRYCSITVGSKRGKIKPLHGNYTTKTMTINKLKEELYSTYERAVNFVVGRLDRKPRNWRRLYGLR